MKRDELLAKLRAPEDRFVERKLDGVKREDIRKTMVAFANSVSEGEEAVLFVGVQDNGVIEGCPNPDQRQKSIRVLCAQDCYPPIEISSEVLTIDEKAVVAVIISASKNRPHFSGQAYIRRGSESIAASPQVFDELIHSRNDIVAAILKIRDSGETVSVEAIRHKLGSTRHISDGSYHEYAECKILECNTQFIRLFDISTNETLSEPMANLQLARDEKRYRAKLIVRVP